MRRGGRGGKGGRSGEGKGGRMSRRRRRGRGEARRKEIKGLSSALTSGLVHLVDAML